jgi:protein phosphatase
MSEHDPSGALKLRTYGASDIGKRRPINEDRVLAEDELGLYVVADGAGGHDAGELAAERAVSAITEHIAGADPSELDSSATDSFGMSKAARRLAIAVQQGNRSVRQLSKHVAGERGVGTTVVAALFSPRTALLHVAHVGDSRCYRLRAGNFEQLTQDHSLITDVLEERPDLPDEVLARLPKHVVTQALGMADRLRVSVRSHAVVAGDRYLLCTDGLSGPIPAQRLARLLASSPDPEVSVRALIDVANDAGGPDNIAALVICCDEGPSTALSVQPELYEPDYYDDASDPELLIIGIEDIELGPHRDGASDDLLRALGSLMDKQLK